MRKFLITYPNWDEYGINPPRGKYVTYTQIAPEYFQSSSEVSQLALQLLGTNIIRQGADPTRLTDIRGSSSIMRQMNFTLLLLQAAGTAEERADTSEFLLDFTHWLDEQDIMRKVPAFGDDPQNERTWATDGAFLSKWDSPDKANVYAIRIHKIYTTKYQPIFE